MLWPILSVAPIILILLGLERLAGAPETDWWRNLQAWALQFVTGEALMPVMSRPGGFALLHGAKLPLLLACPIFLIARDLGEYLYHRAQHRVPLLWRMHSLHHSDPEMSVLTTQRHFWGDQFLKALTIWPLAAVLIEPTPLMVGVASLLGFWNFFTHARLKVDFGRWSWVINSPAYHRRHHSMLPEHYDSNFAALFPVFDVIFGSYHRPDGFPPTGLPYQPKSFADLALWPATDQDDEAEGPLTAQA